MSASHRVQLPPWATRDPRSHVHVLHLYDWNAEDDSSAATSTPPPVPHYGAPAEGQPGLSAPPHPRSNP